MSSTYDFFLIGVTAVLQGRHVGRSVKLDIYFFRRLSGAIVLVYCLGYGLDDPVSILDKH